MSTVALCVTCTIRTELLAQYVAYYTHSPDVILKAILP